MKNLSLNLKTLLTRANISESELARCTSVGQSVIHRLASGETKNPKMKTLNPIAKYFSLSIDELFSENLVQKNQTTNINAIEKIKITTLPILGLEQIASWLENNTEINHNNFINIADLEIGYGSYITHIQDSTLHPRFPEGTSFIIDPTLDAKNKDFVVFCKLDNSRASIRQLLHDNDEKYLKALNPDFRTIPMNQEYKLLGTVVQARIDYRNLKNFSFE